MAGDMQYMENCIPETDSVTIIQYILRLYGIDMSVVIDPEYRKPGTHGLYPRRVQVIGASLDSVGLFNKSIAENVVKMQMRIQ